MKPKIPPQIFKQEQIINTNEHDKILTYMLPSERLQKILYSASSMTLSYADFWNENKIKDYKPEFTLSNGYSYIGSVDLYIGLESTNNLGYYSQRKEYIIEFKTKIVSISEVIRQLNVYSTFLGGKGCTKLLITTQNLTEEQKKLLHISKIYYHQIKTGEI